MQRYNNIQSPYDPYSGVQLSYTRYTGYRNRDFVQPRSMNATEIRRAKFFGALVVVGFVVLAIVEVLA
jgi:hypothetical protein